MDNEEQTERQALYAKEIAPLVAQLRDACEANGFHVVIGVEVEVIEDESGKQSHTTGACNMSAEAPPVLQACYYALTGMPAIAAHYLYASDVVDDEADAEPQQQDVAH